MAGIGWKLRPGKRGSEQGGRKLGLTNTTDGPHTTMDDENRPTNDLMVYSKRQVSVVI